MGLDEIVGIKRARLLELAAQHGVSNLRVFGSVARGTATPASDLDLLADGLENAPWGGGALLVELEALLGRKVHLVGVKDIHPLMLDNILQEAVALT